MLKLSHHRLTEALMVPLGPVIVSWPLLLMLLLLLWEKELFLISLILLLLSFLSFLSSGTPDCRWKLHVKFYKKSLASEIIVSINSLSLSVQSFESYFPFFSNCKDDISHSW